jgi:adenylate cyclase
MKLSLSFKLLIGLSLLIVGMIASVSYFNSKYIKDMILQRERDFNLSTVEGKSNELVSYVDKKQTEVSSIAAEYLASNDIQNTNIKLEQSDDILSLEIYSVQKSQYQMEVFSSKVEKADGNLSLWPVRKNKAISELTLDPAHYIILNSTTNFKNIANGQSTPSLALILPYSQLNSKLDLIVIAHIDSRKLLKIISSQRLGELFILNNSGELLLSSKENVIFEPSQKAYAEPYQFAKNYPLTRFSGLFDQGTSVVSFVKNKFGLYIFNQVPTQILLAPAELVVLTTFRISGYFLAAAIFLLFLFSLNLTKSLEKIARMTLEIARGNFDHEPTKILKQFFKDEVHTLAVSVDKMLKGLIERDRFKTLFNKFHGSAVTNDLIKNEIVLRGEKKNVFVFFSDLRGFTQMSESKDPSEVVTMLNEYFSYMVPAIDESGGVVDKFIGDAIMAVWGVPNSNPDDGKNALTACLKMRTTLNELNMLRRQRGEQDLWIGMGLHYGEAISGTIGSMERMEYTVIGNTINTASRIEASTKAFGTDLLVSEEVQAQLPDFIYELAGSVEAQGRSEPLKLYKVKGLITEDKNEIEIQTPFSSYTAEKAGKIKIVS